MKAYLLGCAGVLALCACVSHPPRCDSRLTPINRQSIRPRLTAVAGQGTAQSAKADGQ